MAAVWVVTEMVVEGVGGGGMLAVVEVLSVVGVLLGGIMDVIWRRVLSALKWVAEEGKF